MKTEKHPLRQILSVLMAIVLCFGALPFALPIQAEASDTAYHWTITVNTTNKADMDEVLLRIY